MRRRSPARYDHVLVDEYQDVNPGRFSCSITSQVRVTLGRRRRRSDALCIPGRGRAFILDFPQKYRRAQVHVLDRNYRSASQIVAAAERLIANNRARRPKLPAVIQTPARSSSAATARRRFEARQVARAVARLIKHGRAPREIAALYRVARLVSRSSRPCKSWHSYEVRGAGDMWQGVGCPVGVGSLYYLRTEHRSRP